VTPQAYYRSKWFYVFVFSLQDSSIDPKHNYFFVRKTRSEVEEMGRDNHQSLVTPEQEVTVVVGTTMKGHPRDVLKAFTEKMKFSAL